MAETMWISFQNSLLLALRNRFFMSNAVVWAAYLAITSFVQSSAPFIVAEICLLNKGDTVYFYVPGLITLLIWYPLVTCFFKRWGKWSVYTCSLLMSAIVFPETTLMGDWLPISMKVQCTWWALLQSFVISGVVVLFSTFVAEITDIDAVADFVFIGKKSKFSEWIFRCSTQRISWVTSDGNSLCSILALSSST
jgi:Na+/melibiose symporter-like transporter